MSDRGRVEDRRALIGLRQYVGMGQESEPLCTLARSTGIG